MIKFENGKFFSYDMIGEFHSSGEWIHPKRRINSFEIIFVLDGTVYIAEETQKYTLQKNQLLLLEPYKEHYGYVSTSKPVAFYWFHFFTDLEIAEKTHTGTDIYDVKELLKKLLHITNSPDYSPYAADAAGLLIFEEFNRLSSKENASDQALAVQIREYIRNNIKKEITISDIARHFGYNADYIGKYFKKSRGVPLKKYLAEQRLRLAKDLLLTTDMSVKQIAKELGYSEENNFTKFFIYHETITPVRFRNKYCNTHINNA